MAKIGIIIQARMGSTRLPQKMIMPFWNELALLDIVLEKFRLFDKAYSIVLATSVNPNDDVIESFAVKHHIHCFRGDESNVLDRFIQAAEAYQIDTVVRVCADNPFLSVHYISALIDSFQQQEFDYISFGNSKGIPAIKTHYGFFAELVKLSALQQVKTYTQEPIYFEHVTNFIYSHEQLFDIHLLKMPFHENDSIRLTIDTVDDFNLAQKLYSELIALKSDFKPETIVHYLSEKPNYLHLMHEQIKLQQK